MLCAFALLGSAHRELFPSYPALNSPWNSNSNTSPVFSSVRFPRFLPAPPWHGLSLRISIYHVNSINGRTAGGEWPQDTVPVLSLCLLRSWRIRGIQPTTPKWNLSNSRDYKDRGNGVWERNREKWRKEVMWCLLFWQMLQKAEFTANWKLFLLEYIEVKTATQVTVAAFTVLSLIQSVQAHSNKPS